MISLRAFAVCIIQFVAHANCQQHLVNMFYGREMRFIQSMKTWQKVLLSFVVSPLLPFICLLYIVLPHSPVGPICYLLAY